MNPMYNAVLLPKVRYHPQLSSDAKVIFAEMTACVDDDQLMDCDINHFERELNIKPAIVFKAIGELRNFGFIKDAEVGQIWVDV